MNKERALEEIKQLIDYYKGLTQKDIESFSEEDTKKDFILPLFHILGWQTNRRDVVVAEEQISKGFVDYSFRINGVTQFYLEAKPLKADLEDIKYAKQSINYAWLKNRSWAVLTDFEGLKVFNAQLDIKDPYYATVLDLKFDDFIDKFDKLCLLSPESFLAGDLDKYAEEQHKKKGGVSVSEQLADDLNEWREELAKHFKQLNKLTDEEIDDGVQKILDRLIFIRTCEDRGIEDDSLLSKYREWEDKGRKGNFQTTLKKLFEEYNSIYNSGLFAFHPVVEWETYSDSFEKIIKGLYGASEDLIYDFKQIDADVLGSVYEQYLGFVQGKKEDKKDSKRKKQGIYYTPTYIVDYIVKNTLGELIKEGRDVSDIKVLDPACGSGSFLIKAFEYLVGEVKNEDKTKEYESDKIKAIAKQYQIRNEQKELPKSKKINILRNNIYGVDLDEQAIEIAKLNLLLKATDQKEKLPYLTNLRNGNSLVSGTEKELKEYFGKDWKDQKPFNWNEEFSNVIERGGFDVIIGNPPWVSLSGKQGNDSYNDKELEYFAKKLNANISSPNLYEMFIWKALSLLRPNGFFSFIVPDRVFENEQFINLRKYLLTNFTIRKIWFRVNFPGVIADTVIFTIQNKKPLKNKIEVAEFPNINYTGVGQDLFLSPPGYNIFYIDKKFSNIFNDKIFNDSRVKALGEIAQTTSGCGAKSDLLHKEKQTKEEIKVVKGLNIGRYQSRGFFWFDFKEKNLSGRTKDKNKLQEKYKILLRKTGKDIIATFDDSGVFPEQSLYFIYGVDKRTLLYILGIINSKLINVYYNNFAITNRNSTPQLKNIDLDKFPIVVPNEQQKEGIIQLVVKIINLNDQLDKSKSNPDNLNRIEQEIQTIDKLIDSEVYNIYKLSDEEIKIIKGEQ